MQIKILYSKININSKIATQCSEMIAQFQTPNPNIPAFARLMQKGSKSKVQPGACMCACTPSIRVKFRSEEGEEPR